MESKTKKPSSRKAATRPASKYKVGEHVIYDGNYFQIVNLKQTGFGNTYKLGGRIGYVSEYLLTKSKAK